MTEPHTEPGTGEPPAGDRHAEARDPYRVLGVRPGAPQADIARAFRRLARTRHPDVAGPEAATEYRRIRQAYEQLTGQTSGQTSSQGADPAGHTEAGRRPPGTRIPVRVRSTRPRRGRDIAARVRLSLAELITGTTRTLARDPDSDLDGDLGQVTVRIPAGVTPGTRLRVTGQGALGSHGGAPGDLVLTIDLTAHPDITVDGRNLRTRLPVSFGQAVLGADLSLTVPGHGPVRVTVPPGTQHGTTLCIPGAGLPATDRHTAGDLYAEIKLHVPTRLTPQARQAIADLDRLIPRPQGADTP